MTTFAVYALFILCALYIAQRIWTLFFGEQQPAGRVTDVLIVAFYFACMVGLWPLTWGAPS